MPTESPPLPRLSRDARRERTRRLLLDAAARVFADRGYHAASVDEVAHAAGMTKGAVYSNFDTKEELFLAVLGDRMGPSLHDSEAAFDAGARSDEIARRYEALLDEGRTWLLLKAEFWLHAMRNPDARFKLAARQRVMRDGVARLLDRQCDAAGIDAPVPPSEFASVVLAISEGLAVQRLVDPAAVPDDLFARTLEFLFDALDRRSGEAGPTGETGETGETATTGEAGETGSDATGSNGADV